MILVNTIDSDLAHIHYDMQKRKEETTYIVKYQPLRNNKKLPRVMLLKNSESKYRLLAQ